MKIIAKNRRAQFDFTIERTLIAGIVLSGAEAKSIRGGLVSLKGAFAYVKKGELWIFNMHVSPYPYATNHKAEPTQPRKLLVTRHDLANLQDARLAGRAIVPLRLLAGRHIKLELGIGTGKKKIDKRQTIKKRDTERSAARELQRGS